jgi:hypothetical protein
MESISFFSGHFLLERRLNTPSHNLCEGDERRQYNNFYLTKKIPRSNRPAGSFILSLSKNKSG